MTNRQVLLIIAAFIALTLGSFIWYIATWDSHKGDNQTTLIILPEILPPEAPVLATGTTL
ncbi:hypothetical protein AL073_08045 [Loktanella sp. 1ANDIMAR09]|nr:hypothetical protein AL073_08045 [Loktanella sp. 1ANDIMAR09]